MRGQRLGALGTTRQKAQRRQPFQQPLRYQTEPKDRFGDEGIIPPMPAGPSKRTCSFPDRPFEADSTICVHFARILTAAQYEAARVLRDAGIPVTSDSLQAWEIGRWNPRAHVALALAEFLQRQPKRKPRKRP
jgi:hypothetical protein